MAWEGVFASLGGSMSSTASLIAAQAKRLSVEYDQLDKYKSRVDELIAKLEGSAAGDKHLKKEGDLPKNNLGTGFTEATALHTAYTKTVTELQTLSHVLTLQLEALAIAVVFSRKGYENMDDETKRRMAGLAATISEKYDAKRDPNARRVGNGSTAGGEF
ncbi:hypothetical protein [Streptomyces sp. NPDC090022]|uniref:hypothetical protein n=1 Tax=Streptomyces sp. NPDC090022 TaxID=3365920 RepID=UPI0037F678C6